MALKNTVGAVIPTPEEQQQLTSSGKSIAEAMHRWGIILKPEDRNTYPKPRTGGEKLFELLIALGEEYKVTIATMPLSEMKADVAVARAAENVEREVAVAHQLASDTRLAAYGEAWQAFLGYYGVLSSMASRDPNLAERLAPITAFMARRRPQPEPKPETK